MFQNTAALNFTRAIHWGMAALIIGLICLGFYMANTSSYALYDLHKSLGVITLSLIFFRLIWRRYHPWRSSSTGTGQEKWVKLAHRGLLILLTLMPLSGLCLSGFGGYGVSVFGLPIIPSNYSEQGEAVPHSVFMSDLGYLAHEVIAYLFSALLLLHILAAVKHHVFDRDETLKRMLGLSH